MIFVNSYRPLLMNQMRFESESNLLRVMVLQNSEWLLLKLTENKP